MYRTQQYQQHQNCAVLNWIQDGSIYILQQNHQQIHGNRQGCTTGQRITPTTLLKLKCSLYIGLTTQNEIKHRNNRQRQKYDCDHFTTLGIARPPLLCNDNGAVNTVCDEQKCYPTVEPLLNADGFLVVQIQIYKREQHGNDTKHLQCGQTHAPQEPFKQQRKQNAAEHTNNRLNGVRAGLCCPNIAQIVIGTEYSPR